jgi:hypothetical protein
MIDPASAEPRPENRQAPNIGSFSLGPRVMDQQQRLGKIALFAVAGLPGTPQAGVTGFAYCTSLGENGATFVDKVTPLMARIQSLDHAALVPVLEAGIAGRVAYVAEAAVPGERLSDLIARERRLPPWRVARIVEEVSVALDAAHNQRISHGLIVPTVIWIDNADRARLGGLGISGRGPARDQEMLAALAFELIAGRPWAGANAPSASGAVLIDQIRGQVQGLTERMATAIARGLEGDPAKRFSDVLEFGTALRDAVSSSAQDLVAGAWEAVSRGDMAMAGIIVEMVTGYDPNSAELPLLRLRLNGDAMSDPAAVPTALARPIAVQLPPASSFEGSQEASNSGVPGPIPAGDTYDEAELKKLFSPPITSPAQPRGNPWVIFLVGVFGMILLFVVLAAVIFAGS